jgi:lysophospholipase L1-like esterase
MPIRRSRPVAVVLALVAALCLPAPAATAAGESYVALGDSYSSGTGTRTYLADGSSCQRSVYAYPSLIASERDYELNFRACAGATVPDVVATQLDALTPSTDYVSLSVGGNDAAFVSVLTTCARPAWLSNCHRAIDRAQTIIRESLPGSLASLYGEIRLRAPQASVTIAGYPRIFSGTDCNFLTWFSAAEQSRLNETADLLNSTTAAAAAAAGFSFRDPTVPFTGHAVCDEDEWLNGLSFPVSNSYHPNQAGHAAGYTPLLSSALTGSQVIVTAGTLQSAEAAAPALALQQSAYAERDAGIRPEEFELPDLKSPEARAAAERAGVDLSDPDSIDRADRAAEALQNSSR